MLAPRNCYCCFPDAQELLRCSSDWCILLFTHPQGKTEGAGPKEFAPAFRAGVEAIQKYGGARAGSRTMLDAMLPACEALEAVAAKGEYSQLSGIMW